MSPYFSNSFVDANFFDKTDPVEDKAVDDILVLASNDEINLLIPYSVKYEIEHPNTPTDVKLKLSELIYSIKVQLNSRLNISKSFITANVGIRLIARCHQRTLKHIEKSLNFLS